VHIFTFQYRHRELRGSKLNLEEEALNYSKGKEQLFVEELTRQCEELDTFIVKHLAPCPERNHVMQSVREVFLWARYCSELNGVK